MAPRTQRSAAAVPPQAVVKTPAKKAVKTAATAKVSAPVKTALKAKAPSKASSVKPRAGSPSVASGETRIAAVDAYIAKSAEFAQPILSAVRDLVHEAVPEVTEQMKWSMPFFVYRGVILGNMAAFKQHCSFGLWGKEVTASLRADGVAEKGNNMGSFGHITSINDLPPRRDLISYLLTAAKAIATGERTKAWSRPRVAKAEAELPEAFAVALKKNKAAATQFAAMSPSCRREYASWIAGAKREETRDRRIATALEWIAEGKSQNWKYERP